MLTLAGVRSAALRSLIPPRLGLSTWIKQRLRLPEDPSALPGVLRPWPYERGVADCISDPEIERVTLVKAVRLGFTTLLTGAKSDEPGSKPEQHEHTRSVAHYATASLRNSENRIGAVESQRD